MPSFHELIDVRVGEPTQISAVHVLRPKRAQKNRVAVHAALNHQDCVERRAHAALRTSRLDARSAADSWAAQATASAVLASSPVCRLAARLPDAASIKVSSIATYI